MSKIPPIPKGQRNPHGADLGRRDAMTGLLTDRERYLRMCRAALQRSHALLNWDACGQRVADEPAVAQQHPHRRERAGQPAAVAALVRQRLPQPDRHEQGDQRREDGEHHEDPAPGREMDRVAARATNAVPDRRRFPCLRLQAATSQ